jgi:hypothetical protein
MTPAARAQICLTTFLIVAIFLPACSPLSKVTVIPRSPAVTRLGPLKVLPSNSLYFMDATGKALYLTGWYPGYDFQDNAWEEKTIPQTLKFTGYLNDLKQRNLNHIRMCVVEHTKYSDLDLFLTSPMPWVRVSGVANDGQLKFDLNRFDQGYFDRLRSRIEEAQSQGIYVTIMLFQGWSIQNNEAGLDPWSYHPFNRNNNINDIDGDPNGDNQGSEIHTLQIPAITALQDAYVRKVIDTVNDLDNILYEISNESPTTSKDWQYHMINLIKTYQATKPKQHPVGMTFGLSGNNADLMASPADWISPGAALWSDPSDPWIGNPPAADGRKVIIADSDHIIGGDIVLGDPSLTQMWIWKSFMRGLNPIMPGTTPLSLGGDPANPESTHPSSQIIWNNLGYTRSYANRINLAEMTPQGSLSSTGFALVNTGNEYLVYQPDSGSFTVNLVTGSYSFEWFNPASGSIASTGSFTASSGNKRFTPPFSGKAVLYLKSIGTVSLWIDREGK